MSYNLVNPTTGDLTQVAGGGGTLYADLPIGSWIKNNMNTLPSGFLKEGDAISQSECPELYAKYGATVPYKADTSELSDYEKLNFPASLQVTAQYDGVIITTAYDGGYLTFNINDNKVYIRTQSSGINAGTATVPFRKGDVISIEGAGENYTINVRYYKKSLIVKAKQTPVPVDFMDAVYDAMNSVDFATIISETANVSIGDHICSKNIRNVCAMIKGHTSGIVLPSTKICSGFFTPLTPSTYAYLDIPFAIRNRNTNVTEMRMGYLDTNGDFYTSAYTENIESDWDIQLFFSYITG